MSSMGVVVPVVTEATSQVEQDVDVVARRARRIERFADPLHASFGVGHRAIGLAPRRRSRQHDVGELRGLGPMDVEHDEVIEPAEQVDRPAHVGLGLGRVLADDEERPEITAFHRVEHLGQVLSVDRRDRGRPFRLELRPGGVVLHVLEPGQLVGERTHVAAALHVVLPAQRGEPGAVAADLSGEEREVAQREHVVDTVVVLGDAQRPAQLRRRRAGVGMGELADRIGGDTGDLAAAFERPVLD